VTNFFATGHSPCLEKVLKPIPALLPSALFLTLEDSGDARTDRITADLTRRLPAAVSHHDQPRRFGSNANSGPALRLPLQKSSAARLFSATLFRLHQ
jgi:hypothetical protein